MRGAQHFGHSVFVRLSGTLQSCAAASWRKVWSSFCAVRGCGGEASAHRIALSHKNWQRRRISLGSPSMTACYRSHGAMRSKSGSGRGWTVPVQGCCTARDSLRRRAAMPQRWWRSNGTDGAAETRNSARCASLRFAALLASVCKALACCADLTCCCPAVPAAWYLLVFVSRSGPTHPPKNGQGTAGSPWPA